MKKLTVILGVFTLLFVSINVNAQQTAFNENNQNRAIGIARVELSDCLAKAYSKGPETDIIAEARGQLDNEGNQTGDWTVVFRDKNRCTWNGRFCEAVVVGFVHMEDWVITYSECR